MEQSSSKEPTHFDALCVEIPEEQPIGNSIEKPIEQPIELKLQKDDFHKMFLTAFAIGEKMTGYSSLHVEPTDESAKGCAYALYECIEEIPALQFLLKPQNKWFDRGIAVGAFAIPMAIAFTHERQMRMKPVEKPQQKKQETFEESVKATAEGSPSPELAMSLGA